ncbi:MAG: CopG family transcriptional regulator [Lentisphaeria bacterium]|nr:ribbon-helix-helix domain-containing protein [Lentisphaeria bacterium]NQZ70325.1 CopG family transcriptional regulator [Lentisphaeria bacterium]
MERTQVYLTDGSSSRLKVLAKKNGQSQSELIRVVIDNYLDVHSGLTNKEKLDIVASAAGSWKDNDISFEEIRKSFDRD